MVLVLAEMSRDHTPHTHTPSLLCNVFGDQLSGVESLLYV